jgi:plastocyanin
VSSFFLLLALFTLVTPASAAVKTGTIQGTVRIEGRIEKVKFSSKKRFSPYVSTYNDGVQPAALAQELIVYLDGPPASKPSRHAFVEQKNRNFTASIIPVLAGGLVEFSNQDTVRHHIRSRAKPWDFNLSPRSPGTTVLRSFQAPPAGGLGVVPIYCDIHPHMRAHVLVMPSEHYALLPERGGGFKLDGVPPGTYTLSAWHPTLKPLPVKVVVQAGKSVTLELVMQGKQDSSVQ